ncbi:MAG: hypothetical protein ACI8RD_004774 [Bacillariaceae sp.]
MLLANGKWTQGPAIFYDVAEDYFGTPPKELIYYCPETNCFKLIYRVKNVLLQNRWGDEISLLEGKWKIPKKNIYSVLWDGYNFSS